MADVRPVTIRPAVAEDQAAITDLIHQTRLNPRDLDWHRFVVAVADGQVVGVAQVRTHRRGTHELASVAVDPSFRGSGVGSRLLETLIAGAPGTLYLMTRRETQGYFARFGFEVVESASTPADFRRQFRIGQIATAIFSTLARRRIRLVAMRREATAAE
jgi:N-acetylglutamate synthase-like GNAT family acetyltransferase